MFQNSHRASPIILSSRRTSVQLQFPLRVLKDSVSLSKPVDTAVTWSVLGATGLRVGLASIVNTKMKLGRHHNNLHDHLCLINKCSYNFKFTTGFYQPSPN